MIIAIVEVVTHEDILDMLIGGIGGVPITKQTTSRVFYKHENEDENEFVNRIMNLYDGKMVAVQFFRGEKIGIESETVTIEKWKIKK